MVFTAPRKWLHRVRVKFRSDSLIASLTTKSLSHFNPLVERGHLGRLITRLTVAFTSPFVTSVKQRKFTATKTGRQFLALKAFEMLKKINPEINNDVRNEFIKLANNSKLKGRSFINKLHELIYEKTGKNENDTKKIIAALDEYVHRGVITKKVTIKENGKKIKDIRILDLHTGELYSNGEVIKKFNLEGGKDSYNQAIKELKKYGIDLKKEYADIKESKILVETLLKAENPKHAAELYETLISKELQRDPFFAESFLRKQQRELVKTYNAGGLVGAFMETLTTVPSKLISLLSRMLATAYRMVPIVGAIAATQVEAAGAVSEIGEAISSKVGSSAYMYYSLKDALGNIGENIKAHIIETTRRQQQVTQ